MDKYLSAKAECVKKGLYDDQAIRNAIGDSPKKPSLLQPTTWHTFQLPDLAEVPAFGLEDDLAEEEADLIQKTLKYKVKIFCYAILCFLLFTVVVFFFVKLGEIFYVGLVHFFLFFQVLQGDQFQKLPEFVAAVGKPPIVAGICSGPFGLKMHNEKLNENWDDPDKAWGADEYVRLVDLAIANTSSDRMVLLLHVSQQQFARVC